jgi:hypothetical protein
MMTARTRARKSSVAVLVSIPLLWASRVEAQGVATSFEQLRSRLKPGDTIQVTDDKGRKTTGQLGELTASSLELLVRKTESVGRDARRLAERDIRKIALERRDSLLNGALIGLAAGAAPGILLIAGRSRGSDPIQHADIAVSIVGVPGAVGAGIGTLIDALRFERTTVYVPPGQSSSRLQVLPVLSTSTAGAQVSVRF